MFLKSFHESVSVENKENQRQIYNSFPSLPIQSWTFKNKVKLFGALTPFKMLTSKYLYSLVERTKGARKVINHVSADNDLSGSCNQTAIGWLGRATLVERESARRAGVTSTSPPRIPPCLTHSFSRGRSLREVSRPQRAGWHLNFSLVLYRNKLMLTWVHTVLHFKTITCF